MKFIKTEDKINKPLPKKKNWKLRVGLVFSLFLFVFFSFFVYILKEYIDTHTFKAQVPVIFRTPIIIKRLEIISPLASPSAKQSMLNVNAYAEEIINPYDSKSPKGIGWNLVIEKWGIKEWGAFEELAMREGGWNPYAINQSSGACGIPQALPCSKMGVELWDYEGQLKWMTSYILNRYHTPTEAVRFHDEQKLETGSGWY